jgi:hypothetical protein
MQNLAPVLGSLESLWVDQHHTPNRPGEIKYMYLHHPPSRHPLQDIVKHPLDILDQEHRDYNGHDWKGDDPE